MGDLSRNTPGRAYNQYLDIGPDLTYAEIVPGELETIQAELSKSRHAEHQHAVGWVAIERSLALTALAPCDEGAINALFETAEEGFTNALDYHKAEAHQLWKVEVDMAAMPLYYAWATNRIVPANTLAAYIEDLKETGDKVRAMQTSKREREDVGAMRTLNGLAAEIIALLAYNGRAKENFDAAPSIALPSTRRQDLATRAGVTGPFTGRRLSGNWDVTTITPDANRWGNPQEKLQIKAPSLDWSTGAKSRHYQPYITPISVRDHMVRGIPLSNIKDILMMFVMASEPHCPAIVRSITDYMTEGMYKQIADHRARLQTQSE